MLLRPVRCKNNLRWTLYEIRLSADPGNITLIMTGPLTNLAEAVQQYPELVSAVKEVIFMGGVVKGVGNVTPVAEYNMFADPEAASIVFEAGFQSLTQVGLDVTRSALLKDEHIDQIQNPVLHGITFDKHGDILQ